MNQLPQANGQSTGSLAAAPPTTNNRETSQSGSHAKLGGAEQKNQTPSSADPSTVDADRKNKKRIQNRVAQRTYRSRVKQRLQDLQQQVYELQATRNQLDAAQQQQQQQQQQQHQQEQPQDTQPPTRDNHGGSLSIAMPGSLPATEQHASATTPGTGSNGVPDLWGPMPSEFLWNTGVPPHQRTPNMPCHPPPQLAEKMSMEPISPAATAAINAPAAAMPPLGREAAEVYMGERPAKRREPLLSPHPEPSPHHHYLRDSPMTGGDDDDQSPSAYFASLNAQRFGGSNPWDTNMRNMLQADLNSPPATVVAHTERNFLFSPEPARIMGGSGHDLPHHQHHHTSSHSNAGGSANCHSGSGSGSSTNEMGATPSTTTAPSELSDDAAPRADAAIEDRFEYVLSCAKRAGFDGFDAMALQYYAHNFDGRSPLALEQRLSRNRQLPRLLSELSRRSGSWSAWQRSGFLDETLKAAEQICARECGEYRAAERERETRMGTPESMDEMPLEDRLPHLFALLMGLASRNPLLPQKKAPSVVLTCMKLLCGVDGAVPTQLAM